MPIPVALGLLAFELVVLAGGLLWTFRRGQLPVGWLGALGLASVVAIAQVALVLVVELALDLSDGRDPTVLSGDVPLRGGSVLLGALAAAVAAPLALKRFLNLDARWTRALSRELLAGFLASAFGALVVLGVLLIGALIVIGALQGR